MRLTRHMDQFRVIDTRDLCIVVRPRSTLDCICCESTRGDKSFDLDVIGECVEARCGRRGAMPTHPRASMESDQEASPDTTGDKPSDASEVASVVLSFSKAPSKIGRIKRKGGKCVCGTLFECECVCMGSCVLCGGGGSTCVYSVCVFYRVCTALLLRTYKYTSPHVTSQARHATSARM
jgi:hypothetical protein